MHALILSKNKIKDWPGSVLMSLSRLTSLKLENNPLRKCIDMMVIEGGYEFGPKNKSLSPDDIVFKESQPLDGIQKVVFSGQVTNDEVKRLNKRSKIKEEYIHFSWQ